jgi:hypothetical protein
MLIATLRPCQFPDVSVWRTLRLEENIMQRTLQTMMCKLTVVAFFGAILIFTHTSTAIAGTRIHGMVDASQIRLAIQIDKSISAIQNARDDISVIARSVDLDVRADKNIEISKSIQGSADGVIKSEINSADINHISDLNASNIARRNIIDICENSAITGIGGNELQASYTSQGLIRNGVAISRINGRAIQGIQNAISSISIVNDRRMIGDTEDITISQGAIRGGSVNAIAQINADIIQDTSVINSKTIQDIANARIIAAPNKINLMV